MQKQSFLLFVICVLGFTLISDDIYGKGSQRKRTAHAAPWLVGVHTGINFGFATSDSTSKGAARKGFVFGVEFEKRLYRFLHVQPEFRFIQKGVATFDMPLLGNTGTVKLDSLQIPVLFKAKLGNLRFNPFIFVGPSFAIALQREIEFLSLVTYSLSDRFKGYDLALEIGGGADFLIAPRFLASLTLRYALGLIDLDRESSTYYSRGFEILLGCKTVF